MPEPLRALFFVDVPHRIAGAQRSLLAALGDLPAHGVHPIVVFPGDGACADAYRRAGLEVHLVPAPAEVLQFGKVLLHVSLASKVALFTRAVLPYCHALARFIADHRVAVAHFNTARGILLAGMAARLAGIPSVLHLRGEFAFGGLYRLASQALADRIVVVARALESQIHPAARHKVVTVYNGIVPVAPIDPAHARQNVRERHGLDVTRTTFLSLSSPVPFKGLHHLLHAAHTARARGLHAHYWLAGSSDDAAYTRWLERLRDDLGLQNEVHFLGHVAEPIELLAAADALVLPSVERETLEVAGIRREVRGNEGLPRSVLEAMAVGRPAIASDVAGVREQIEDGVTGLVVPPGDPLALADALVRVAGDEPWRRRAGQRARATVAERFSVAASARGLAQVLAEACARPLDRDAPPSALPTLFFVDVPHRIAGAQRSLLAALGELPAHAIRPIVVFPGDGACADAYRRAGLEVHVVPAPTEVSQFGKILLNVSLPSKADLYARAVLPYCRTLARFIADHQVAVAHFNTARGILLAGMSARLAGIPSVLHLRGEFAFGGLYRLASQALADRIVVVARALEREIHPAARSKTVTVYNGIAPVATIDLDHARRLVRERHGLTVTRTTFLSLSSPVPFKGLHHLLRAAHAARARGLRAHYWLAGSSDDDAYTRWLEQLRDDLGLQSEVHFLGYVEDPLPLLAAADALVLPTARNEGLPRSVLEAMAVGRPAIASDVAGVREQIEHGVTGLIAPPGDEAALAEALLRVAADPGWRARAGEAARRTVAERFSVAAAARGLAQVIAGARAAMPSDAAPLAVPLTGNAASKVPA